MKSILVVDDEAAIREMLEDYLDQHYLVATADNGDNALKMYDLETFDLVIADINMPGMKGYEFLQEVKKRHPGIRTVLITAYNVDDYVRLARQHGISNIIAKTIPFNFDELSSVIDSLISGNIFGIRRYMTTGFEQLFHHLVKSSSEAKGVASEIVDIFSSLGGDPKDLKVILSEILTNALYHAPRDSVGRKKYSDGEDVILDENEFITVTCARDQQKYGISVTDPLGNLDKEKVLLQIERHTTGEGLFDESGRGIFLTRMIADRMVINIDHGKRTEVILLNYFDRRYEGYKPLYINEL